MNYATKAGNSVAYPCTAANCIRQVHGKKSYINFLIEAECHYAKDNSCGFPKYVRRPTPTHFKPVARKV